MQKVNIQFFFANNILKRFVKFFYQISFFVSDKSLYCGLQANAKAVIEEILDKS